MNLDTILESKFTWSQWWHPLSTCRTVQWQSLGVISACLCVNSHISLAYAFRMPHVTCLVLVCKFIWVEKSVVSGCFLTCILDIQQPKCESSEQMASDYFGSSGNIWSVTEKSHNTNVIHLWSMVQKEKLKKHVFSVNSQEIRMAANQWCL